jgi:ABC-type nitrate/sulfonate/bicarbonate transport system substrate-binding protein
MKKMAFIPVLVLVLTLTLSACSKAQSDEGGYTDKVLCVNDSGSYASAVTAVIRVNNLLDKYLPGDVKVEWSNVRSAADIRDAIVANKVDVGSFAGANFISAIDNGLPLTLLANALYAPTKLYSNNTAITSIDDIDADTVITLKGIGANPHFLFLAYCKERLGDAEKLSQNLTPMADNDVLTSLASSKDIDCAVLSFPHTAKAEALGTLTVLADFNQTANDYGVGGSYLIANSDFCSKNPTLVDAFLSAYADAVEMMRSKPNETSQQLAQEYDIDAKLVYDAMLSAPARIEVAGYDKLASFMYEIGLLDHEPKKFSELPNYESIPKAP